MEDLDPFVKNQLDILKDKLNSTATRIKTILEHGRSVSKDPSQLFMFKGMYKELKSYFDTFNNVWDKIIQLVVDKGGATLFPTKNDKQIQQLVERYYYECCAIYEDIMNPTPAALNKTISESNSSSAPLNESRTVRARLPQINLPEFDGSPLNWPLFRDTYLSLIHNEVTLSNMERFLFLVSCLRGPARSLISNISLTEANYNQAWKLLTEHYNNKRKLAHTYLKQVIEFKPLNTKPNASALKTVITSVVECIDSFKHLEIENPGDFILSFLLLRCLDSSTRLAFEKKYAEVEFPSYQALVDFIKIEWKSIDAVLIESDQSSSKFPPSQSSSSRFQYRSSLFSSDDVNRTSFSKTNSQPGKKQDQRRNVSKQACPVCDAHHSLYQCKQFRSASVENKLQFLREWTGCTNCLSHKHQVKMCPSLRRCSNCNQAHHTWLHQPQNRQPAIPAAAAQETSDGVTLGTICAEGQVLLGTAIVEARNAQRCYQDVRIVTDSGSQFSFMTQDCARRLGLKIEPCNQKISGIGQVNLNKPIGKLRCAIRSKTPALSSVELPLHVIVVPQITGLLPQSTLTSSVQSSYKGYCLADPNFWKPAPVEILLGGDLFFDIITGPPVAITDKIPKLLPTIFGFIVAGPLKSEVPHAEGNSFLINSHQELNTVMDKFWEVEEIRPVIMTSAEDQLCETHYEATHYRLESGRYVVSLPVKDTISTLENPKGQAFKRLLNLEAKLAKDPVLKKEYHQFMQDYLDLGHMRLTDPETSAYTLPHHPVVKFHNGNIKLRTVFDASCKSKTGSLNDHLFTGPKLQHDIRELLTNFRIHEVVFTADIIKMYRQILIHPPDRKYQHIFWRFEPAEAVKTYELCTLTYGQNCAPFDAQRTLIQLVKDEGAPYPLGSKVLLQDIYVDDVASGASSVEDALQVQAELKQLLGKGCFGLSKWASNHIALLMGMKEEECQLTPVSLSSDVEPKIKLLGMQWIPNSDIFTYEVTSPSRNSTKRAILSAIAHIYDPLGFLSPVVFYAKTILQDLWIAQCGWDECGPPELCSRWYRFIEQLHCLSNVRVPRKFCNNQTISSMIVGFSDASQRGYSAVLYLLNQTPTGCDVHLLKAKTKLAPIKPMTIPRLELSGALLLSQLYNSCKKLEEKLTISDTRFFTDSELVLGWLSTPPHRLNTFVAHRVVLILELIDRSKWSYVKSEDNPADCSSRGVLPSELPHHPLWWAGPKWLQTPKENWPSPKFKVHNLPELKKTTAVVLSAAQPKSVWILEWMERFSSLDRLLNSIAYAIRFIKLLHHGQLINGPITLQETREAALKCVLICQKHYKIDAKHLKSLNPFQDRDGLFRVGGRLKNSALRHDAKHPIIVSPKSHFVKLLVDHYHKAYLHLGPTALQALLQSKYWIVKARSLIRKRVFNCLKCYKFSHSPQVPLMGNLPSYRLEEGQVFHHVGVDFGGPFHIRESLRRKASLGKAYLCLFICMATKALHLELVSKCSTSAFLAAFDRFVARRGKPVHMYSDCGTNFVGAANKLKDLTLWFKSRETRDAITRHAAQHEVHWSFNPPSAPHFGGIWEAGIKAAKTLLHKVIGDTALTFEELTTLFCCIEGVLNSRPLTPLSSDPDSLECLTPGHFLVGRPLTSVPEESLELENISPLKRWDIVKQTSQRFWTRWRNEYLHQLQQRRKWTTPQDNLKIGDLVILKEPHSPQRTWPLGRVIEVHPGMDEIVRVVTIRTSSGSYKRPVAKLVPLTPVFVLGFIIGIVNVECTISDNGLGERTPTDSLKSTVRNPLYRNQVRKQRPGLSAPPYAVPMEPVFKYSQRDPLYDRNAKNSTSVDAVSISSKADYDIEQTKHVSKRVPHPNRSRRPPNHHHHHHHGPPRHPPHYHHPHYYPEPPEPIIEIIIKESNVSLPAPTTTPPPPTTKEPIHVFYVKYKKNPNPTEHGDEIIYEEPVPALTPHETEIVEGEQPNYGPTYAEAIGTPAPPPSTTLRTIIRPDSETYHGSGLKVTFGGPEHDGHGAEYGQSAPRPQVALPEEKESVDSEEETTEEVKHSYAKRQQPFINKQQRQDQPIYQSAEQLQYTPPQHLQQPNPTQLITNHRFPGQINQRNFQRNAQPQHNFNSEAHFQSGNQYHGNQPPQILGNPTQQTSFSERLSVPPTQQQFQNHYNQGRIPQQRRPTQSTVTDQQIQEYQKHKEYLLKQQALQAKLASQVPPTIQSTLIPGNAFQNNQQVVHQRQPLPHIHVEQSPIIDQSQLNPQIESFTKPLASQAPKTHPYKFEGDTSFRFREKETNQGIRKFPDRTRVQNNPYYSQREPNPYNTGVTKIKSSFTNTDNSNDGKIPNAEIIKSISSLEDHQIQPGTSLTSEGDSNPTDFAHNHRVNQQTQAIYRVRNQQQANHQSQEQTNTRFNVRNEDDNSKQIYNQGSQQDNIRFNVRNNQYSTKQPSVNRPQSSEERQPDISKYLTVYSRPPNAQYRRPTASPPKIDNRDLQTTSAPNTEAPKLEPTTEEPKKEEEETAEEKERKKANIAALPDEVPDDLRQQLLSSGILGNADIQILDYDKVGDIPIESLPPEALENFYGAASDPIPSVVKPDSDPKGVEMRVVRYDPNSDEAITNKYFQENATRIDPVFLNDSKYKRYLPLKVSGTQFPIPDIPQLKDKTVNSVVVLAPVDYDFIKPQDDSEEGRRGRIIQIQGVKFVVGDSLMTVIKNPTQDNFKKWLKNELAVPSEQQSVILLVTKGGTDREEIWMYEAERGSVRKLKGELSSAFVELASSNSESEDLERLGEGSEEPAPTPSH